MSSRPGFWAARCFAPWCLAGALLVALTAGAGPYAPSRAISGDEAVVTGSLAPERAVAALARVQRSLTTMLMRAPSGIGGADDDHATAGAPAIVVFADEPGFLPTTVFAPTSPEPAGAFREARVDGGTGGDAHGDLAPAGAGGATSPLSLSTLAALRPDGSTPSVPRAVALSSTTPAPIEPTLVQMPTGFAPVVAILNAPRSGSRTTPN